MKDSQILSGFHQQPVGDMAAVPLAPPQTLVFDACQIGVMLRAVLLMESVIAMGAMFVTLDPGAWLALTSLLTAGGLTGTLLWLISVCGLKRWLQRLSAMGQYGVGMGLGALSGLYGCAMLALTGLVTPAHWVASAFAGMFMAGLMVAALLLRARGSTPAATAARLAELQARIRPHFLFNTLNSAIALVRAEPARAEALLEDLAELFRSALAERGDSGTLAEEIALARRYLAIEQLRFGPRLSVEWAIDPAADGARLPPLLLQPLVENAVKHGVEPSASGAQLRISSERRGGRVVIKVTNTVPSGAGAPGHGLALDNVQQRLRLLHDLECRFSTLLQDGLFQVRIEVPAPAAKDAA